MALPGLTFEPSPAKPTPVGSLLDSAASPPQDVLNDIHWTGGLRFVPQVCANGQIDSTTASPNEGISLSDASAGGNAAANTLPFEVPRIVEAGYRGSALGNQYSAEDYAARATNALQRNLSRLIELEFWDGRKTRTKSSNNFFLSNNGTDLVAATPNTEAAPTKAIDLATILTGTSYKIRKAFGALEEITMQGLGGGQCMIHVPIHVMSWLRSFQMVETQGPLVLSKLGNIVVAGVGYTGSAPGTTGTGLGTTDATQDTTWIYGTDVVTLWLEPTVQIADPIITSNIDKTVNLVEYRASRYYATTVNRCVNYAVKVDLASS